MVVAGHHEHPAVGRGAIGVAVLQRVAGAVDAGALAVPHGEDAVDLRPRVRLHLLGAEDGGGGEVLVDRGQELDAGLGEALLAAPELEVESPAEFQGALLKTVMQRRGTIVGTTEEGGFCRVEAEVPLAEMFGYSTDLRSCTQGKAEFTMEFSRYLRVPGEVQNELIKKYGSRIAKIEED